MPLIGIILLAACYAYFIMIPSFRDYDRHKRIKARAKHIKRNLPQ